MLVDRIWKEGERYWAEVRPDPSEPEGLPQVIGPLPVRDLRRRLDELNCHPVDVVDALDEADPEWSFRETEDDFRK